MKTGILAAALAAAVACTGERVADRSAGEGLGVEAAVMAEPTILFLVGPLAPGDGAKSPEPGSVWSQNDHADTVPVVLSNVTGDDVVTARVSLIGRLAVEGDARVDSTQMASRFVEWRTLAGIQSDSLPVVPTGRLLLTLHPSQLWDAFKAAAGSQLEVDSVMVEVDMASGRHMARGLLLLWD